MLTRRQISDTIKCKNQKTGGDVLSGTGKKKKSAAAPIYAFAVVWLVMSVVNPLYSVKRIVITAVLSLLAAVLVGSVSKAGKDDEEPEKEPEPEQKYSPEVEGIISEGKKAQSELGRLYASIGNPDIKRKIRDIMEVSDKIVQDAKEDPNDVPQIKKFLDYYLPTTIKLLNAYDRMGAQGIEGENISGTMSSIEEMLDTAIVAYKKLLDSLFADQAMDIETDIQVMNTLLKREGLAGGETGFAK